MNSFLRTFLVAVCTFGFVATFATNGEAVTFQIVNLEALAVLGDGATVDRETLISKGMIRKRGGGLKILGEGEAPKNLTVKVQRISAVARQKIEAAGGSVDLVK